MSTVLQKLRRALGICASLMGTYAVTSLLGLAFWTLAARQFPIPAVGVAGVAVALMTLISVVGTLGFGTMLITEMPRTSQQHRRVLVRTCLLVSAVATAVVAVAVPLLGSRLFGVAATNPLQESWATLVLFGAGCSVAAVALVLDQAVLVIGVGQLQLTRNIIASAVKLAALAVAAMIGASDGMAIFAAWAIGNAASLPYVAWATRGGRLLEAPGRRFVQLSSLRGLGRAALGNQALNLVLQAPLQILPIVVTSTLSLHENGIFTTVLQLSGIVFTLPYALAIGVFASAEGNLAQVREQMRLTIPLGLGISALAIVLMYPLAPLLLAFFGAQYADEGTTVLRLFVVAGLTFVLKDHFVAYKRVEERTGSASLIIALFSVAEVAAATWGATQAGWGLVGLIGAWIAMQFIQAVVYAAVLARSTRQRDPGAPSPRVRTSGAGTVA